MRLRFVALVTFCLLLPAVAAQDNTEKDLKHLAGTWGLVSGETKGEKLPAETIKTAKLIFKGDMHTVQVGDVTMVGTHKLDAAKKPKTIDVSDTEGPFKGKILKGIYKLEGDEFTVCFGQPGEERPKEFSAKSPSVLLLHTWKKMK